jgi:hypothetical protein
MVTRDGSRGYASPVSGPIRPSVDPQTLLSSARELIETAAAEGLPMRLLGGLGVYALSASARRPPLARRYRDFDLAVPGKRGPAASRVLEAAGLVPDRHFNALHGARRMIFEAPGEYAVDLLVGRFEMCHALEIQDGFDRHDLAIAPADLLLTKLQIVSIESKDLADAAALVLDVAPGAERGSIEPERFVAPLAEDWGFHHTVELNIPKLRAFGRRVFDMDRARIVDERLSILAEAMAAAPKSMRWRLRARVGERMTWYETPEEVE